MTGFARDLLSWYDRHRRPLPWRQEPTAYRTLVSELMLQQTVVATVIPYFERFCARFPTLAILAEASEDEVLAQWSGLGYYRRARHLHAAARAVVRDHGGVVPREESVLRSLPGIGPYTAAAVAAIAYEQRAFALDGNAGRVMARALGERESPARPAARKRLHAFGLTLVPDERAGDFAQAVMELGALVCTPTSPDCPRCPVQSHCRAFAEGLVSIIPAPTPKKQAPKVRVSCLRIENAAGRVWLERRREGLLAGTLALPMRDVPAGEEAHVAGLRLWRELGGEGTTLDPLGEVRHVFTHRDVTASVFRIRLTPARQWDDGRGSWCEPLTAAPAAGLSTFARKTLALSQSQGAKTRQISFGGR